MTSQSDAGSAGSPWQRRGCGPFRMWHPVELLAVVLGFALWWPLGLAVIAYKLAQRKGYAVPDFVGMASDTFKGYADAFRPDRRTRWRPFATSGNAAFDEWRTAELAKLEEQRRRLDDAEREFAAHMDNLRRAKDRAEFERFMAGRQTGPTS